LYAFEKGEEVQSKTELRDRQARAKVEGSRRVGKEERPSKGKGISSVKKLKREPQSKRVG